MELKDILNKVSDSGYVSLSETEFNELKKYPEQKEIFNKISDSGYASLSPSEFEGLKSLSSQPDKQPNGYQYPSNTAYNDLRVNVGEVGYSGLDPEQKKLFQAQFPQSKFAKAGGSFEDAVKYVDSQSSQGQVQNLEENRPFPVMESALPGEYSTDPRIQRYIKEHPGTVAATAASVYNPLTWGGVLLAGLESGAGIALDKAVNDEYSKNSGIDNAIDIGGGFAGGALSHGALSVLAKGITAPYRAIMAKNEDIAKEAVAANEKIAQENAAKAAFNKRAEYESMKDPETNLGFYRNELMRQNPDVAQAFRPKFGTDLSEMLGEMGYYSGRTVEEFTGRVAQMQADLERVKILTENARREAAGLPPLPIPSAPVKPPIPKIAQGIVEPSDWDAARFKLEMETPTPEVVPEFKELPNVNIVGGLPNWMQKIEGGISNVLRGENAGTPAWYSFRNNPYIYPAVDPLIQGIAPVIDQTAAHSSSGLAKKLRK